MNSGGFSGKLQMKAHYVLVSALSGVAALAGDASLELSRHSIDAGGVIRSAGGDFELSGTIGQPDAGVLTGGNFTLTGGFWFEEPPGDCNENGIVELLDHADFTNCLTGPLDSITGGCECFDLDRNGKIDLVDFAQGQIEFTGD